MVIVGVRGSTHKWIADFLDESCQQMFWIDIPQTLHMWTEEFLKEVSWDPYSS